jgi:hypothetical protein
MARILLKTTIAFAEDDWHIGRFAMLRDHLLRLGHAVTARDRETDADGDDIDLIGLGAAPIDQVWLFAVDCHAGLTAADGDGIAAFRARGGGVLATRDHQDLGACLLRLGELGAAHHFHELNPEREADRRCRDDLATADLTWPNYHSGANGDVQHITVPDPEHPLLRDGARAIGFFPAHPHEGAVSVPPGSRARVVATGVSAVSGRPFNLVVAFEGENGGGRALAHSSFHHFCDYNWDPRAGCPSFVSEPPSDRILRDPQGRRDIEAYVRNAAAWLG